MVPRLNQAQFDSLAMQNDRAIRRNIDDFRPIFQQDRQLSLHDIDMLNDSSHAIGLTHNVGTKVQLMMVALAEHGESDSQASCHNEGWHYRSAQNG